MSDIAVTPTAESGYGGPDMIQMLTPEGERIPNPEYDRYVEDLTDEDLRAFYRDMVLVRRMDTEGTALQRQGQLGLWGSLLGQEAAQIGCGRALRPQDYAFPGYREHGIAWTRGVDPVDLLAMWRCTSLGAWDPKEKGMQLYSIVIGNNCLLAAGYAMGQNLDGVVGTGDPDRDAATIVFFGDGATAQGDINESFVIAGVNNAPLVFFCQNNQWAISEPNERQTRAPLYKRADGFGFPGVRVDGNDVLASYAVAKAMLDRARSGQGPALIEAYTYRMSAHTTSDDPTKYRVDAEVEVWKLRDPISRLRSYLARSGAADQAFFDAVDAEADAMAARLREGVISMPDPDPVTMFDHTYVEPDQRLERQREAFVAYTESFEEA